MSVVINTSVLVLWVLLYIFIFFLKHLYLCDLCNLFVGVVILIIDIFLFVMLLQKTHDGHSNSDSFVFSPIGGDFEYDFEMSGFFEIKEILWVSAPIGIVLAFNPPFAACCLLVLVPAPVDLSVDGLWQLKNVYFFRREYP